MSKTSSPDWDALLNLYEQGAGDPEIARALGLTMKKFYNLIEEHPPFADFVEKGRTLSMAWWYEKGRTGLFAEKFNTSLFNFNMKNRFGWADKVDTTTNANDEVVNSDALKSQLAQALKKLGQKNPELLSGANLHLIKNAND